MGPPAICNACGKPACTLDQAGMRCYHCEGEGVFVHRYAWDMTKCRACAGDDPYLCVACGGLGCIVTPKEMDLDLDALYQSFLDARRWYELGHRAVPEAVSAAAEAAEAWLGDSGHCAAVAPTQDR